MDIAHCEWRHHTVGVAIGKEINPNPNPNHTVGVAIGKEIISGRLADLDFGIG
jgi:hypothetical protein